MRDRRLLCFSIVLGCTTPEGADVEDTNAADSVGESSNSGTSESGGSEGPGTTGMDDSDTEDTDDSDTDDTGEPDPTGVWLTGENLETPPTREFSPMPAPGVHPRVLMSPEDLPAHRAAATSEDSVAHAATQALREHIAGTLDDPDDELGQAYQQALAGTLVAPSNELLGLGSGKVGLYGSGKDGLYGTLAGAAWVALMDDDEARGAQLGQALAGVASAHDAVYEPELDNKLCHDVAADLGLAYDFLHPYMSDAQRDAVRGLLSRMTSERVAYGVGMSAAAVSTNWRTHHDHIVIAALAIEGEPGYDANVYESNVEKLRLFASEYGITSSGMPHEGLGYFAFGMHWGALSTLASARRGDNLFETTHYYRSLHYALRETAPWGMGQVFGHADGVGWATGTGASSFYTVSKFVWPEDPLADYIYRQNREHGRQTKLPLIEAMFGLEPLPEAPTPASLAASLELPLTLYSPLKGYAYARSDWGPDATRLDFDVRSDLWELGHIHADRNSFTMLALGRRWVFDPGGQMEFSDMHSGVLIDGRGQSGTSSDEVQLWPPMPAKMVEVRDSDELFVATGDASLAYSLARPRYEELPDSGYTWADFLADPAYLDEHHAESVLARSYNPVAFAYRSVALVRGPHPFVVIADDIEKDDDAPHTFEWVFNTRGPYPWNQLTMVLEPGASEQQAVLRHEQDTEPGTPRLLVQVLRAEGSAQVIELRDEELESSTGAFYPHRRLIITRAQTTAPGFRIALIPFRAGDPLPELEYDGASLTVTQAGDSEQLSFSMVGDRTYIE